MLKQLPSLLKLKSYKSVYALVSSYIKNEKLRRMLSMHPLLVGGNPFTTTSIYSIGTRVTAAWSETSNKRITDIKFFTLEK